MVTPTWHTTSMRRWINVIDVDSTSQQRRVPNGTFLFGRIHPIAINQSSQITLPLNWGNVDREPVDGYRKDITDHYSRSKHFSCRRPRWRIRFGCELVACGHRGRFVLVLWFVRANKNISLRPILYPPEWNVLWNLVDDNVLKTRYRCRPKIY